MTPQCGHAALTVFAKATDVEQAFHTAARAGARAHARNNCSAATHMFGRRHINKKDVLICTAIAFAANGTLACAC
jgi:dTDP-4-amino-4,6-dideoxygalactose transaminase